MALSFLCLGYLSFFDSGVEGLDLVKEASVLETDTESKKAIKVDVKNLKNYWISSEALIAHGKIVYGNNCAVCHGAGGRGDGPASQGLKVRDLIKGDWRLGGSSIALFQSVTKGIPKTSMAAFQHLSLVDRWALVHFIRSITKNKVKDTAQLETFGPQSK